MTKRLILNALLFMAAIVAFLQLLEAPGGTAR